MATLIVLHGLLVYLIPEHFDLDHDQISRSKWSILVFPEIQKYFRKITPNGADSIVDVSRLSPEIIAQFSQHRTTDSTFISVIAHLFRLPDNTSQKRSKNQT